MGDFLCKIWRFLANIFEGIVNFVFDLIRTIADLFVELVGDLVDAVLGGGLSSLLGLLAIGFVAYLVITKDNDKDKQQLSGGER